MRRSSFQPRQTYYPITSPQNYFTSQKQNSDSKIHKSYQKSQSIESIDADDLITIELDQLKHQNQFLKKKLQDAIKQKSQLLMQGFGVKPKKTRQKKAKRNIEDNVQLSLDFFFKSIHNLINNIRELFKISIDNSEEYQLNKKNACFSHGPIKSHVMEKQILFRKLERIKISQQDQRYPMILDLFTDYYRTKTQTQKNTIFYIDQMTDRALDLSKWMLQKAKRFGRLASVDCQKSQKSLDNCSQNNFIIRKQDKIKSQSKQSLISKWKDKTKIISPK